MNENGDDAKERGAKIRAALGLEPPVHPSARPKRYALEKLGSAVDILATEDSNAPERVIQAWREVGPVAESDFETEEARDLFVSARAKARAIIEAATRNEELDRSLVRRAMRALVDAFWVVQADEIRKG
jgi:hypothetical protein